MCTKLMALELANFMRLGDKEQLCGGDQFFPHELQTANLTPDDFK